jgi:T5SS/PEP-CTERM-associated repeat protein
MTTQQNANVIVVLLICSVLPVTVATATTKNWIAGTGNWNTAGNWAPAGVPAAGDDVNIKPTNGVSRTVTYDYTGPAITLNSLGVNLNGGTGGATTTLQMSANNLTVGELDVGWSGFGGSGGNGTFTQTGGTTTVNGPGVYIGVNASDVGTYNLSGSAALTASTSLVVGSSGLGTLNIQGNATAFTNSLSINTTSNVNLNGGTLRFNTVGGTGGLSRLNYTAGTIRLGGNRNLGTANTDSTIATLFGSIPTIPSGKSLIIEGDAEIRTVLFPTQVNGGSLSSAALIVGFADDEGELEITNGGVVTSETGSINVRENVLIDSFVTVSGPTSQWIVTNFLAISEFDAAFNNAILNIRDGGLVSIGEGLAIQARGVVNLDGGTIRFNGYGRDDIEIDVGDVGIFNFNAGTIQLAGNRNIGTDEAITDILGVAPRLTSGKGLTVEGTATLLSAFTLDGGTFSVGALASAEELQFVRGTLNVTNQAVTIGAGGPLGRSLDVNVDMTINVTLGITNQGLVTGDGQIGGTFTNAVTGELRAQAGRSLRLTGANNTNAGQIKLFGGELEFTQNLTNSASGFISGNGSLIVGGGFVNQGTMNFAGTANIDGAMTNAVGGKIISGGGGATIFYDDVINNGEIRISTNGFTVFFGAVSGSGTFTGTGTVNFEGDLSPGNSPGAVNFAGDVVLGPEATLQIELGGTSAGTQYDQINVTGELMLDGTLEVSLINGFTPSAGQTFDILNWGSLAGAFSSFVLPALDGLAWNTSQLASGTLTVAIPGDFNFDGTVGAADYVVWRKGVGVATTPENYDLWRVNFGRTVGDGGVSNATVPEPAAALLTVLGVALVSRRRHRLASRVPKV